MFFLFNPYVLVPFLLTLYTLCLTVYRLFLSPLARIPGPKLAALSTWYEIYFDVVQPGQYVWKIQQLHKQYGPILRITPREVHIADPAFLDTIYTARRRSKDPEKVKALGNNASTGGAVHYDLHARRRGSLSPFFSQQNVLKLEGLVRAKVTELCERLEEAMQKRQAVNLSDLYFALALDVVSQYSFGKNDDVLGDSERAGTLRNNLTRLLRGVKFNLHFSWVRDALKKWPAWLGKAPVPPGVMDLIRFRLKIRQSILEVLDDKTSSRKGQTHSIFYDLRDDPSLSPEEKALPRLEDEGTLIIMAGTESTAKSIGIAHYYLLTQPLVMKKLRAELATVPNASLSELEGLPYLNGIISEANRLSFGLTGRNSRIADEDLQYHKYTIPAGTPMSTSTLCIHANHDIFPDPWVFNPDRWLGDQAAKSRKYQCAFGRGPRKCVGMNLANAELFLSIVAVTKYDMELVGTNENDVRFQHDYHVAHPALESKGIRANVTGKVAI